MMKSFRPTDIRTTAALDSYRRAFKLDPDIDYAYKRHYQETILPSIQDNKDKPVKQEGEFKHIIPLGKEYTAPSATRKDPLADLIMEFLNDTDVSYIPQLDYKPVAIAKLPSKFFSVKDEETKKKKN